MGQNIVCISCLFQFIFVTERRGTDSHPQRGGDWGRLCLRVAAIGAYRSSRCLYPSLHFESGSVHAAKVEELSWPSRSPTVSPPLLPGSWRNDWVHFICYFIICDLQSGLITTDVAPQHDLLTVPTQWKIWIHIDILPVLSSYCSSFGHRL